MGNETFYGDGLIRGSIVSDFRRGNTFNTFWATSTRLQVRNVFFIISQISPFAAVIVLVLVDNSWYLWSNSSMQSQRKTGDGTLPSRNEESSLKSLKEEQIL